MHTLRKRTEQLTRSSIFPFLFLKVIYACVDMISEAGGDYRTKYSHNENRNKQRGSGKSLDFPRASLNVNLKETGVTCRGMNESYLSQRRTHVLRIIGIGGGDVSCYDEQTRRLGHCPFGAVCRALVNQ